MSSPTDRPRVPCVNCAYPRELGSANCSECGHASAWVPGRDLALTWSAEQTTWAHCWLGQVRLLWLCLTALALLVVALGATSAWMPTGLPVQRLRGAVGPLQLLVLLSLPASVCVARILMELQRAPGAELVRPVSSFVAIALFNLVIMAAALCSWSLLNQPWTTELVLILLWGFSNLMCLHAVSAATQCIQDHFPPAVQRQPMVGTVHLAATLLVIALMLSVPGLVTRFGIAGPLVTALAAASALSWRHASRQIDRLAALVDALRTAEGKAKLGQ